MEDLLTLSRAEAGEYHLRSSRIDLGEVAHDTVRSLRALAERRGVEVAADAPAEMAFVGDEELVRRALSNLVENAIKYSRPGDRASVSGRTEGAWHRIRVSDSGPGIPAEDAPHVFERFYRGARARARAGDSGAGLGLPIARWVAEVHGGELRLVRSTDEGTVFELMLPVAQE